MRHSLKTGFSFGSTSGVITTLGLIVGLHSGTHSRVAVLGGIITIAVADAFSDALGIHVSEESEGKHTAREIWESTFSTFAAKFLTAMTFLLPFIFLRNTSAAIFVSIIWGLFLLGYFNFHLSDGKKMNRWKMIGEHVFIALIVIIIAHLLGDLISSLTSFH